MKISYDKKADAFSLILKEGRISRDMEIAEGVFAGFDRKGDLIEMIFPSKSGHLAKHIVSNFQPQNWPATNIPA